MRLFSKWAGAMLLVVALLFAVSPVLAQGVNEMAQQKSRRCRPGQKKVAYRKLVRAQCRNGRICKTYKTYYYVCRGGRWSSMAVAGRGYTVCSGRCCRPGTKKFAYKTRISEDCVDGRLIATYQRFCYYCTRGVWSTRPIRCGTTRQDLGPCCSDDPGLCKKCVNGQVVNDDGVSCDDGKICTTNDRCTGGVCKGEPYPCTASPNIPTGCICQ